MARLTCLLPPNLPMAATQPPFLCMAAPFCGRLEMKSGNVRQNARLGPGVLVTKDTPRHHNRKTYRLAPNWHTDHSIGRGQSRTGIAHIGFYSTWIEDDD